MDVENEHFSRDEILDYLNINLEFDRMVTIDDHLRSCKSCKNISNDLENESNKSIRNKEFDEETANRRNAIIQAQNSGMRNSARFGIVGFVLIAIVSLGYYNSSYLLSLLEITNEVHQNTAADNLAHDNQPMSTIVPAIALVNNDSGIIDSTTDIVSETIVNEPVFTNQETQKVVTELIENEQPVTQSQNVIQTPQPVITDTITAVVDVQVENVTSTEEAAVEADVPLPEGTLIVSPRDENQASPVGGYDAFKLHVDSNFIYPTLALQRNVEGNVVAEFIIVDEKVSDIKILNSLGYGCDEAVVNLLKNSPPWKTYIGEDFVENKNARVHFTFKLK